MRTTPRGYELDLLHGDRVDDRHAHAALVAHVDDGAVGRKLDVDGEAAHMPSAHELHVDDVDLHEHACVLGRDHEIAAVGAEVEVIGSGPRDLNGAQQLPPMM